MAKRTLAVIVEKVIDGNVPPAIGDVRRGYVWYTGLRERLGEVVRALALPIKVRFLRQCGDETH